MSVDRKSMVEKTHSTNNPPSTALTHTGMESTFDQSSTVTKTMIEIARLLPQAQEDISALDISMWFQEYEGPPESAELILL